MVSTPKGEKSYEIKEILYKWLVLCKTNCFKPLN
jgi:hypothetical protein